MILYPSICTSLIPLRLGLVSYTVVLAWDNGIDVIPYLALVESLLVVIAARDEDIMDCSILINVSSTSIFMATMWFLMPAVVVNSCVHTSMKCVSHSLLMLVLERGLLHAVVFLG